MKRFAARALSLLTLVLLLGPLAAAQDSPVVNRFEPDERIALLRDLQALRSGDDPVPDTTDWRRYFPLDIGNQWQYRWRFIDQNGNWGYRDWGLRVVADTVVSGTEYRVVERCSYNEGQDEASCPFKDLVRYEEEGAMLVNLEQDYEFRWGFMPCGLDADFNTSVECPGGGMGYYIIGENDYSLNLPPNVIEPVVYKQFLSFSSIDVVHGIGPIYYDFEAAADVDWLMWARIDGVEFGTPRFVFPTSSDEPPLRKPGVSVEAWPNPFREHVTVAFSLTEAAPVVVELVDVLGRVVVRRDLGVLPAGEHREAVGAAALPSGSYVVRVHRGAESVTTRITRL